MSTYFEKWKLQNSQLLAQTDTSQIYKVIYQGQSAILKLLTEIGRKAEGGSAEVLNYFNGTGAVQVLKFDEGALLLEYVDGITLENFAINQSDEQAAEIIADVVAKLHSVKGSRPQNLKTIGEAFKTLHKMAKEPSADPIFIEASRIATNLIETETDVVVLHGDLHHQNILQSQARGWIAIDPQAFVGERTYDLANNFFNPKEPNQIFESKERIQMYARIFSRRLNLDEQRILQFAFVCGCLSACWYLEDGKNPERRIRISKTIHRLII